MKLIRLLKRITAIIIVYTLQTKLRIAPVALVVTDVSRLLRSSWRAVSCSDVLCRACCTASTTQHVRLFPIQKGM